MIDALIDAPLWVQAAVVCVAGFWPVTFAIAGAQAFRHKEF